MITKVKVIMGIELLGLVLLWGGGSWVMIGVALMLAAFLLLLRRYLKVWKKENIPITAGWGESIIMRKKNIKKAGGDIGLFNLKNKGLSFCTQAFWFI